MVSFACKWGRLALVHTRRGPAAEDVLLVKLQQLLDERGCLQAQKAKI